ncbi:hypothetical protein K440DRAFT_145604 [Wilcoxina mikolae CBS 423.85]|nr:hypothetical protein K440DRAFT_145604 [Wilcoxina mikolae CBS 423.85]
MPPASHYSPHHYRHHRSTYSSPARPTYASPVTSSQPSIDDLDNPDVISRAPNCSVCDAPAKNQCGCELTSLIIAVEDSEQKILGCVWDDIRRWVTSRAQSSIHTQFHTLSSRRRAAFSSYISTHRHILSTYDLDELHHKLQRDIDADWRTCVQQYPEALDHYYGVIEAAVRSGRGVEGVIYEEEGPSSAPLRSGESVRYSSQERVRYTSPRARESERPSYSRSGGRVRVVYE